MMGNNRYIVLSMILEGGGSWGMGSRVLMYSVSSINWLIVKDNNWLN